MRRFVRAPLGWALALWLGTATGLAAWPWSRDMVEQAFLRPLVLMWRPAEGSVFVGAPRPITNEAAEGALRNPYPATGEHRAEGARLYRRYCFVCHGATGRGDGPVAGGALAPADLTSSVLQRRGDGYFYAVMRNGVRTMAQYHEMTGARERWLIVLHLRELAAQARAAERQRAATPSVP
jgi:mono/diheme cytochrome c family protein